MSKEMLGGCCVCSDERGWTENPLVYCDGQGCTVAVHQACYGIVTVPTGPWFCRKCESQERAARVRCELCPSRDGALKRTDNSGWAHVVCALYIPEVRFGNVTTMEPIILQLIPSERYSKVCYICQEQGKGPKSTIGACMQCNKTGCKQQFHVTCAQALGLLCEEAGNYLDNVKYCGYCQHHYSKLKKGGNVKTIPPYKPITSADNGSSDSSPEKESEGTGRTSSGKKKSYLTNKALPSGTKSKSHSPNPSPVPEASFNLNTSNESDKDNSGNSEGVTLRIGTTTSHAGSSSKENSQDGTDLKKKFTTSNFTETIVTESEPVFGTDTAKTTTANENSKSAKKRKSSIGNVTPPVKSGLTKSSGLASGQKANLTVSGTGTKITISAQRDVDVKSDSNSNRAKTDSNPNVLSGNAALGNAVTVPISSVGTNSNNTTTDSFSANDNNSAINDVQPAKRARSSSFDKNKKNKRSNTQPPKRSGRSSSGGGETNVFVKEIKESPPGSPLEDSRKGVKKKGPNVKIEEKDVKPFQNTMNAPHMLGNQLNPNSSMAQKMHDSLNQEVEAHSIYTSDSNPSANLVGPQLHGKVIASVRAANAERNASSASLSAANSLLSLGNSNSSSSNSTVNSTSQVPNQAQSLEQLLERQWEQGSQFLMEQAQHFDIASLLSCLHQLKAENLKLEEHVNCLLQRRDHLLAVNARLAVPLNTQPTTPVTQPQSNANNIGAAPQQNDRINRQQYVAVENGLPPDTTANFSGHGRTSSQSSPTIRHNPSANVYGGARNSIQMDSTRRANPTYQGYPPSSAQVPVVTSPSMVVRREDSHQQM
ncbi:UNVERIFIED_CONTAM: hypothetical protein PYX00_004318 [Menopon gallinae]|uniref:Protein AF-10 n=1 Tax=Menopon gallinae TaxID=328185 RepID=A0AAW2I351_9NEOP